MHEVIEKALDINCTEVMLSRSTTTTVGPKVAIEEDGEGEGVDTSGTREDIEMDRVEDTLPKISTNQPERSNSIYIWIIGLIGKNC